MGKKKITNHLTTSAGAPPQFQTPRRREVKRRDALRQYTEQAVRQGGIEPLWERLVGGLVLGSEAFVQRLRQQVGGNRREQPQLKGLERPADWAQVIAALEQVKGEDWETFSARYGDWGRDAALWLGRSAGNW